MWGPCCLWPFSCCCSAYDCSSISKFKRLHNAPGNSRFDSEEEKSKNSNNDSEYSSMEDYQDASEKFSNNIWNPSVWDTDYLDVRHRGVPTISTQPLSLSTTAEALQPDSDDYYEESGVGATYAASIYQQPSKIDGPDNQNGIYKEVAKTTMTSTKVRKSSSEETDHDYFSSRNDHFRTVDIDEEMETTVGLNESFDIEVYTDSSKETVKTPDSDKTFTHFSEDEYIFKKKSGEGVPANFSEDESIFKKMSRKRMLENSHAYCSSPEFKNKSAHRVPAAPPNSSTGSPVLSKKYPNLRSQFAINQANLMERGEKLKNIEKNMINLEERCKTFSRNAHACMSGKRYREATKKESKEESPQRLAVGSIKIRRASRTSQELFLPLYDTMAAEADLRKLDDSDSSEVEVAPKHEKKTKKPMSPSRKHSEPIEKEENFQEPPSGKVTIRIKYDESSDKLGVHLQKAEDLPLKENYEVYDTLAELMILPQEKEPQLSGVIRDTKNPKYDEWFTFILRDLQLRTLRVTIYERGRQNQDDAVGHALLMLDEEEPTDKFSTHHLSLTQQTQPGEAACSALLRLVYQIDKEKLIVVVLQAKDISIQAHRAKLPRMFDSCDTYAKVTLRSGGDKVKSKRSAVVQRCTDPSYNFNAQFLVPESLLSGSSIVVSIMLKGLLKKSIRVGKTMIGPYHYVKPNEPTLWRRIVHGKEIVTEWFSLYM